MYKGITEALGPRLLLALPNLAPVNHHVVIIDRANQSEMIDGEDWNRVEPLLILLHMNSYPEFP